jgi:uncharacterized protein (TIGR03435 family)
MREALLSASIAILACLPAFGQTAANLTFDVASVKPAAPPPQPGGGRSGGVFVGRRGGPGTADPGQITWNNATLKNLLTAAYDVKPFQVSGPAWLDTERYDIVAKVPAGATQEQVNVMWQNLLAERFGVVVHHESKEFQVEELTVAKGGSKLKETTVDPNAAPPAPPTGQPQFIKTDKNGFPDLQAPGMIMMINAGSAGPAGHMVGKAQTLAQLATLLGNQLNRPVVDKTGLTGKYDFMIEYTPDLNGLPGLPPPPPPPGGQAGPAPAPGDNNASEPGSNLAAAIQQQLGLKLVGGKAKLDVVVVDKAEKAPTEN